MECPRCQRSNRAGGRFCAACGNALPGRCPACQGATLGSDRFCGHCGRQLADPHTPAADGPATGPERRQLTTLFCDLVGSTALSQQLDPEDVREIILAYQHTTRRLIERYDGYVARYVGDGVLAYFGYPSAHEDDAARAVHAALEIVAAHRERAAAPTVAPPGVRIGIATGLVIVGDRIGEGASKEAAAVGESVNLAARLQALAAPGGVVISQRTRQLVEGRFEFADHGIHALKGFEHPVRAWRALRATVSESRFDAVRERGMTPFVGRVDEIDLGEALWRRACGGEGQVLLLTGEAGIGKSRVAELLADRAHQQGARITRLQCSAFHSNTPLYPFIQRIERDAQFEPGDGDARKFDKLARLLGGAARPGSRAESARLARRVALLAGMLLLPDDARYPRLRLTARQVKAHTLDALAEWLLGPARQAPCLVLVEDAHWIDPTSMELLDLLARRASGARCVLVVTSRVPLAEPWVGLGHVAGISLERLGADEAAAMARSLLSGSAPTAALIAQIVRLTDGVPLFIEEFTKAIEPDRAARSALGEDHPAHASPQPASTPAGVPLTLQDSLMARLDRLGGAKQVAQVAAVLGREFTRDGLAQLCGLEPQPLDAALEILTASQVVFGRGEAPHAAFSFKHALVQEAAYASLLRSRRQALHLRAGSLLAHAAAGGPGAQPELIAHHLALGGQPLAAARFCALAAKRSLDGWANLEALGHTGAGLAQLAAVEEGAERDQVELALAMIEGTAHRAVHGFASIRVERSFARALQLCERLGDTQRVVDVRRGLFSFYYARGELDSAHGQGVEVMRLVESRPDDVDTRVLGDWMLGVMSFWRGDFPAACEGLERAVSLYQPHAGDATALALQIDPGVNAWSHLTWVLWILGRPDSALACGARAVATARTLNQPLALAMAQFFSCATIACCGRYEVLDAPLDELVAVTTEHGLVYLGSCARVLRGQRLIASGLYAQGLAQTQQALREFEAQGAHLGLPWLLSIMALGHAGLSRGPQALEVIDRAIEAIERKGERQWAPEVWRTKAQVLLMDGMDRAQDAKAALETSLSLAREQRAHGLALRSATSLASLLLRLGDAGGARAVLLPARGQVTEGADTEDLRAADAFIERHLMSTSPAQGADHA